MTAEETKQGVEFLRKFAMNLLVQADRLETQATALLSYQSLYKEDYFGPHGRPLETFVYGTVGGRWKSRP